MRRFQAFGFVADGHDRARTSIEPQVRREKEKEYAERLAEATPHEREHLLRDMEKQIKERVDQLAPPNALY